MTALTVPTDDIEPGLRTYLDEHVPMPIDLVIELILTAEEAPQ